MYEISSQRSIWQVLDHLRGTNLRNVDVGVALAALMYLRWADFEDAEREAIAAFEDTHYEPVLASRYLWRTWCNNTPQQLEELFGELPFILGQLGNRRQEAFATQLARAANGLEPLQRLDGESLSVMVRWLGNQPFETPSDRLKLRDVLDEVLSKTSSKQSGQHFSPRTLATLMAGLAQPQVGESIYDPCFGSAGLLTASLEIVRRRREISVGEANYQAGGQPLRIFGVERVPDVYLIGLTRLVLSGVIDPQIELGDSLERVPASNPGTEGFDIVIANPPWGTNTNLAGIKHLPVQSKELGALYIQHILQQLHPGGRSVVAVPVGLLFRHSEREFRQWLITNHTLEAVISLPSHALLQSSAVNGALLVIRRGGATQSVRFVDASPEWIKLKDNDAPLVRSELISRVMQSVAGPPSHAAWDVSIESLRSMQFDLTPSRRNTSELEAVLQSLGPSIEIRSLGDICSISLGRTIPTKELVSNPPVSNFLPSVDLLFPEIEEQAIAAQRVFSFSDEPVPFIRPADVRKSQFTEAVVWLGPVAASNQKGNPRLRGGDILFPRSGQPEKSTIVRNGAIGAVASNQFFVVHINDQSITPAFLLGYLQSKETQDWIADHSRGASLTQISREELAKLPVPMIPLQMQVALTHRLKDSTDDLLALSRRQFAMLIEREPVEDWLKRSLDILEREPKGSLEIETWRKVWEEVEHALVAMNESGIENGLAIWANKVAESLEKFLQSWELEDSKDKNQFLMMASNSLLFASNELDTVPEFLLRSCKQLSARLQTRIDLAQEYLERSTTLDFSVPNQPLYSNAANELHFAVQNSGAVALFDVKIESDNMAESTTIRFISDVASFRAIVVPNDNQTDLTMLLRWTARTQRGTRLEGEKEFHFKVYSSVSHLTVSNATDALQEGSPYECGDPVKPERADLFFGREEIIDQIRRQIVRSGNVVLLEGNRRSGKSSILYHLEGTAPITGWLGVYCSMQGATGDPKGGISTPSFFRALATEIAKGVQAELGAVLLPDGKTLDANFKVGLNRSIDAGIGIETAFQDFKEYLAYILGELEKRDLRLVLMLDEFDRLQEGIDKGVMSPMVPENIRYLIQSNSRLTAIITGSRRLRRMRNEYWSALFGLGVRFSVTALSKMAARRLIVEPVQDFLTYSDTAIELCLLLTARQPYLIQCLCSRIYDAAMISGERIITFDTAANASREFLKDNEHFATLWDFAEFDRRRLVLFLLARKWRSGQGFTSQSFKAAFEGGDLGGFSFDGIRNELEALGISVLDDVLERDLDELRELELIDVSKHSESLIYKLAVPMMGWWMESQREFTTIVQHSSAEYERLEAMIEEYVELKRETNALKEKDEKE